MQHSRRVYGLDILRAYAIFTVVHAHGYDFLQGHIDVAFYMLPATDGVTVFFVLSGFLIGNIILRLLEGGRTSPRDLMNFWQRRWLRTLPNYMLVLLALIGYAAFSGHELPDGVWRYFLFLQNFLTPHPTFFAEAWSLSIEEWFYVLFPLCLFCLLRVAPVGTATTVCLAAFILAPALWRLWRVETMVQPDVTTWVAQVKFQVLPRLDSIVYGVLTALLLKRVPAISAKWGRKLFAAGILLFLFNKAQLYYVNSQAYIFHFTLLAETLATALLLPHLSNIRTGAGVVSNFLTLLSKVSYAMYLVHLSIVMYIVMPALTRYLNLGPGLGESLIKYSM